MSQNAAATSTPVTARRDKNAKMNGSPAGGLTLSAVYDMTAEAGRHMQAIANEYGTQLLEPLAEMMIRALEHLEWYVEENERMRTVNCKLLLEADQMAEERETKKELERELAGLQLVLLERGRQRDALALKIAELESAQHEARRDRTNATERSRPVSFTDDSEHHRTSTLPHKFRSSQSKDSPQKDVFIKQLQKDLARERKKLLDTESSLIDYQRVQRHMEKEVLDLRKDFAIATARTKRLEEEKAVLLERSEVVDDLRAMRLTSVSRKDESSEDAVPKFYKKDLMMIIQERNELKEKVAVLMEELALTKTRNPKWYGSAGSSSFPEGVFSPASAHSQASPLHGIREMLEGSLVVFDVQNSVNSGEQASRTSDLEPAFSGNGTATPDPSDVETSV